MRRTNIYLDEEQCNALDRLAKEEGIARAELIRRLLDRCLSEREADLDADLEAIDASFGVLAPNDVVVEQRRMDGRGAHLERMWRLNR